MKKIFAIAILVTLVAGAGIALAGEEILTGMVQKIDKNYTLVTDDKTEYTLTGADFSEMEFKTVKILGSIEEQPESKTKSLKVISMEEVKK